MHVNKKIRKGRDPFNIRLKNYRNDVKKPHLRTILGCKHFQEKKITTSMHMLNSLL